MYSLQFWKLWPAAYQRLWWLFAPILIVCLALTIISFVEYPSPTFSWQQLQELKHQLVSQQEFKVGMIDFSLLADNYILYETWAVNSLQMIPTAIDIYLVLFTIGLIGLLAIITVLPRFWFFAGSGAIVFMLSSFQWEAFEIFGLTNKIPTAGVLVIILGIGLYFQFLNATASFNKRLLSFAVAILIIGITIDRFGNIPQPLQYLAINTLPSALVGILLLIVVVAHEVLAFFVRLVGQGTRNTKSLRHFMIISVTYLASLWLAYLSRIGSLPSGFSIPPVLLLMVSTVLSVWGIRQRQPTYENILTVDFFAVLFILSLGTIAFAAVGFFTVTANDIVLLSLNDLILYAHIGYGMMFLFYIASNFLNMLGANFQVYRVLYKPTTMPYFTFRLAGLIFTLAVIFYNNWIVPVNHFISGYYTSLGDLYRIENNSTWSEGYYKRANFYATYNQHAATALAEIQVANGHPQKQSSYINDANSYKPTEFTLVNAARILSNQPLDEIIFLEESQHRLPNSGIINNNLGLAYTRLSVNDSAQYYFEKAKKVSTTKSSAEMNLLGLLAEGSSLVKADSIYKTLNSPETKVRSNLVAIANRQKRLITLPVELPKDSMLNLFTATLIGNYLLNHVSETDTIFLHQSIAIARHPQNEKLKEVVLASAAQVCYANGEVNRAYQLMEEASFGSENQGKYNSIMALWAMQARKSEVALAYLKLALEFQATDAPLEYAVALTESGNIDQALTIWEQLGQNDPTKSELAKSMIRALTASDNSYGRLTDQEKYSYVSYKLSLQDSIPFFQKVSLISNESIKATAILDRSLKLIAREYLRQAASTFNKLQGLHLDDEQLISKFIYAQLRMFAAQGLLTELSEAIDKGILFGNYHEHERIYYEALRQANAGDTINASRNFEWLGKNNSYYDEGVVGSAIYFLNHGTDRSKSYSILSEALQVNPSSVKILKVYIPAARARGYEDYAASALQTLKGLISDKAFLEYVAAYELSELLTL